MADEVLAVSLTEGATDDLPVLQDADLGLTFQLRRTV